MTRFYLSTIDPRAHILAKEYGLGLEIAEYCTAWNMDQRLEKTDAEVTEKISGIEQLVLHGPFNELFPCAIDPLAQKLADYRFRQAISLAQGYGVSKVVLHGGYNPKIYYPSWYTGQSIAFWKQFLESLPQNVTICLENVLEEAPEMLLDILCKVDDPRLRMCLDVGHVNAYSTISAIDWLETCADFISHFHIHNNHGDFDAHLGLTDGSIPMEALLTRAAELCPEASFTLELPDAEASVRWLMGMEGTLWNRN